MVEIHDHEVSSGSNEVAILRKLERIVIVVVFVSDQKVHYLCSFGVVVHLKVGEVEVVELVFEEVDHNDLKVVAVHDDDLVDLGLLYCVGEVDILDDLFINDLNKLKMSSS